MSVAEAVFGRIAGGALVIIGGGTGTQLQAEGVPMDELAWSARADLEQPGGVQHVHQEYIRAGAEVIIASTYASGRAALEPAGPGSRVAGASRSAVRAARRPGRQPPRARWRQPARCRRSPRTTCRPGAWAGRRRDRAAGLARHQRVLPPGRDPQHPCPSRGTVTARRTC
jgi:hypothetical protein